jgi:hypothetical protein
MTAVVLSMISWSRCSLARRAWNLLALVMATAEMLLLSNRKSDVFEEVDIHNALSPEFVILYEFS